MELRQVRYFVGIARAGSFGRAADDLHVAKSALSKQIGMLEAELGAKLFVRGSGSKGLALTDAGQAFMPEAVAIVQAVEDGLETVRRVSGIERGQVTFIAAGGWEAWAPWLALVDAFRQRHPGIALGLRRADSLEQLCEAVVSGEADLGVASVTQDVELPRLRVEHLLTERILIALPPGHPLAAVERLDLEQLAGEQWVLPPVDRDIVAGITRRYGYEPTVQYDVPDKNTARDLVLGGQGITVLGESEVEFWSAAELREVSNDDATYSLLLILRRGFLNAGTRSGRDFLREAFGLAA
jgi:DNA-binding transcriptional LysR family regulator